MILCIHKEEDNNINYSQYTTERTVTFENVKPGQYAAHFGSNFAWGERGIRIDVREGEHKVVTFEGYILTYITIGGIQYPKYAMKAYVN
jgi:hypothetical protein